MANLKDSRSYQSQINQDSSDEPSSEEIKALYPEFRRRLLSEKTRLIQQVGESRASIKEQQLEAPGDVGDESVLDLDRDLTLNLADREREELLDIQDALARMERGVYGECESCGINMSLRRLKAKPQARFCIDCQSEQEKRKFQLKTQPFPKT